MKYRLPLALLALLTPAHAHADTLQTDLAEDTIHITGSYTGGRLVVFGALPKPTASPHVRITVRGPNITYTIRKKERLFGVWVNNASRSFPATPAFLATATTRPLPPPTPTPPSQPFTAALYNHLEKQQLRQHIPIRFLGPTLFRASFNLPATAPPGDYTVNATLLENGQAVANSSSTLYVRQAGLNQLLAHTAKERPWLYGFLALAMALLAGWGASVLFQRRA